MQNCTSNGFEMIKLYNEVKHSNFKTIYVDNEVLYEFDQSAVADLKTIFDSICILF